MSSPRGVIVVGIISLLAVQFAEAPAAERTFSSTSGLGDAAKPSDQPLPSATPNASVLQWHAEPGYRWAPLQVPANQKTGFTLLSSQTTGITFTNELSEMASAANRILLNGAGLATGDFDGDGLPDIYFCSLSGHSALYKNMGQWRFQDITEEAGVGLSNYVARGAVFADVNGDGRLDLLVSTLGHGVICFLNQGNSRFTNATESAGTRSPFGSVTLALADVDGNGTLDLYVTNYRTDDMRDRGQVDLLLRNGQMIVPPKLKDRLLVAGGQVLEYGEPDQLLLNDGQGHFHAVSWTNGFFLDEDGRQLTGPPLDWGLTATFRDINGDGLPDLYVCNDYWTPDRIWINDGQGHFRALARLALRETSSSSMGVDFADIDRDGHLDFIVTDMLSRDPHLRKRQTPARWPIAEPLESIEYRPQIIQNTLLHNRGDGTYEEIANYAGVAASDWTWQPLFLDIDLDGFPDLLVAAGHARDVQDMDAEHQIQARQHSWKGFTNATERSKAFTRELMGHMRLYPRLDMPIFAFRNSGALTFEDKTPDWGTAQLGVHHCIAVADFDNDGDLDLVVNNLGSAAAIYRNNSSAPRIALRLKGLPPNTQGIGAQVTLTGGAVPLQREEVVSGGRYMSGCDPTLMFAASQSAGSMTLTVHWRSGRISQLPGVTANRIYEVEEPSDRPVPAANESAAPTQASDPLFEDVSKRLNHTHYDAPFDDYARQPLLPKKLSELGAGLAWFDVNGDGWDDLIIGSGRGGHLAVFLNDQRGGFKMMNEQPFTAPVTRDQTTVLGVDLGNGRRSLVAGSSNYEDGLAVGAAARQYNLAEKRIEDAAPAQLSSTGPLALADLDGNGHLTLFIGGRSVPGRYPEAASSLLLRENNGRWESDAENSKSLQNVGLVTAAVWSDLDGDGLPDLILACEWGPIRIFKNRNGRLHEATAEMGLDKFTGLWGGVTCGDLDGDGKLDIVAGNWGLNSDYQASVEKPFRLYYGDLESRGVVDLIQAGFDPALNDFTPIDRFDVLARALPHLFERFTSAKAFSEASINAVLGPGQQQARWLQVNTLASVAFLNRGGRFEPILLPKQAQFAPALSVNVADFDGDGFEDIFLSQNFFDRNDGEPRMDAGRGLLLAGDGTGQFRAVPGQASGIRIYGEQRSAAVSDYDQDGRMDIAIVQHAASTKLLHNKTARPGLRVRLVGPPGNPAAIGAALRLKFDATQGPVREIRAGSGYWSQDSSIQVLSMPTPARELWVRWPGGKTTTTALPAAVREVTVDSTGSIAKNVSR
jgi:hypothetical protein